LARAAHDDETFIGADLHGAVRSGWAGRGSARPGTARPGEVRHGMARQGPHVATKHLSMRIRRFWIETSTGGIQMANLNFIDHLAKGDVIENEDVLKIMGVDPNEEQSGAMPPDVQLAGMIERELHRIGLQWTVKAYKGSVHVLTDLEAYEHNCKRQRSGYRKYKRAVAGMGGVDISHFSTEKRREFDLDSRKLSAQYMALKTVKVSPADLLKPSPVGR
jgi:hypothetical protein